MRVSRQNLRSKDQTAKTMKELIRKYHSDLNCFFIKRSGKFIPISAIPIDEFFEIVRKIPYKKDIAPIEVVSRPSHILNSKNNGIDCKKKAILISAYAENNGIPYRLIGSSKIKTRRIHHVFPQLFLHGKWRNADATYKSYKLFEPKKVTKAIIL